MVTSLTQTFENARRRGNRRRGPEQKQPNMHLIATAELLIPQRLAIHLDDKGYEPSHAERRARYRKTTHLQPTPRLGHLSNHGSTDRNRAPASAGSGLPRWYDRELDVGSIAGVAEQSDFRWWVEDWGLKVVRIGTGNG